METLLRNRERKGQRHSAGSRQYSRLQTAVVSHSHPVQEVIRSHNIAQADFGKKVVTYVNSQNFIGAMWLKISLADTGDSAKMYCKNFGLACLKKVVYRVAGRKFLEIDQRECVFSTFQKLRHNERRDEILALAGGAKSQNPGGGTIICPLLNYWGPYCRNMKSGEAWRNPAGSARLEIELTFSDKSDCTTNDTECQILACDLVYEEILTSVAVEASFKAKARPRIEWNSLIDLSCTAGSPLELDLSPLLGSGHIRSLTFRTRTAAKAGGDREPLHTGFCTNVLFKVNGSELFEQSKPEMRQQMLLQGYDYKVGQDEPYAFAFCQNPISNDVSGAMPSSTDVFTCTITPDVTGSLDIIAEVEKRYSSGVNGRVDVTD